MATERRLAEREGVVVNGGEEVCTREGVEKAWDLIRSACRTS